jgi:hypothetical protein
MIRAEIQLLEHLRRYHGEEVERRLHALEMRLWGNPWVFRCSRSPH